MTRPRKKLAIKGRKKDHSSSAIPAKLQQLIYAIRQSKALKLLLVMVSPTDVTLSLWCLTRELRKQVVGCGRGSDYANEGLV